MKIQNPKKRTQLSHLTNLITMARMDGEITEEEKQFIFRIADEAGITPEELSQCIKDSDEFTVEIPRSDEEKRQYLKNAIGVMMADGKITEDEAKFAFELGYRFFGDQGEALVRELHKEILGEMQNRSSEPKKMSEEEIREDVKKRIEEGILWLKQNVMDNAFDILFPAAIVDDTGRMLFMRLVLPVYPLFQLNQRQIHDLKELADKGYGFAQLAMGRYHLIVRPENDSLNQAEQYLLAADKSGMPDAKAFLGMMYRDGHFGLVDESKYLSMRDEAYKKGSFKAFELIAKDLIHGFYGEAKPQEVLESLLETVTDEQGEWIEDPLQVEPAVYDLIGIAYDKLGDKEHAEKAYLQAAEMGYIEGFEHFIMMKFVDPDGSINDPKAYALHLEIGCDFNSPLCHCFRGSLSEEQFEGIAEDLRPRVTSWMQRDLLKAYQLGDNVAPYQMGCNFYFGNFGFDEDDELAWKWFNRGALLSSAYSYKMLAQMVEEGHCPDEEMAQNDDFVFYCKLMSLRLGNDEMLIPVVRAYTNRMLTEFAAEIEQYYLPKVSEDDLKGPLPGEDDDEEYDEEDGKYDAWA